MKGLIYVADDEENIRLLIQTFLEEEGHDVRLFSNGDSLFEAFLIEAPDLVILDVIMPGTDGFSISNKIRKKSEVPILLLTARDSDADYVAGFTAGCDDYFTKPFSPVKLTMQINAILKRMHRDKETKESHLLSFEDLSLDTKLKICTIKGKEVKLTNTEFDVMTYFLQYQARAISREELLENVWGYDAMVETRVTDDTVKRLRKKLIASEADLQIETVWGYGFKLAKVKGKENE